MPLVKQKRLVGGGVIKIVNNTVPQALRNLGYSPEQVAQIVNYIDAQGKIEGAPGLRPEHLPVFDCSLTPMGGGRSISWRGHLRMMAAAQPFLSGAISKTINMPEESTVEDIMEAYTESWKFGLKAVAIYRDNSKRSQPLSAAGKKEDEKAAAPAKVAVMPAPSALQGSFQAPLQPAVPGPEQQELFVRARREKLPAERKSITHKFSVGGHEGYITVGMYDDGKPGEIFIKMAKEGSTLSGIMDAFALSVSISLQYGVPLRALVDKFCNSRFEPSELHRQSEDSLRQVGRRLHRAVARREIHIAGLSGSRRCRCGGARCRCGIGGSSHCRDGARSFCGARGSRGDHPASSRGIGGCAILLRVRHADDTER